MAELVEQRGDLCERCGEAECRPLEFAHVRHTGLCGRGRGMTERIMDIRKHPECYLLLGKECHKEVDGPGYYRLKYKPAEDPTDAPSEVPF